MYEGYSAEWWTGDEYGGQVYVLPIVTQSTATRRLDPLTCPL